jgi:hypothetical protein
VPPFDRRECATQIVGVVVLGLVVRDGVPEYPTQVLQQTAGGLVRSVGLAVPALIAMRSPPVVSVDPSVASVAGGGPGWDGAVLSAPRQCSSKVL